ncbi:unnamed protein product [Ostreobium quekettii]|uniref:phosphoribosylglycinamide formyltransferase 1 n=1 Tax=Ostreobium quekettii TaxID=121088 RepID=A0A8S1ILT5_9CHLO|nr:unnamed protein product [Ostreobium quekettii]|eukprot:evm.model.scf_162EXC.14 EVM.evm.TU.scf_162EXC.14   scf_162EXC:94486-95505(-)
MLQSGSASGASSSGSLISSQGSQQLGRQTHLPTTLLYHQRWASHSSQGSLSKPVTCKLAGLRAFAATPSPTGEGGAGSAKNEVHSSHLAVFVSGGGSNFKSIHAACQRGQIKGEVALVVSNVPTCGGVLYAQDHDIPTLIYPASKKKSVEGMTADELLSALKHQFEVDFILLAGYLRLIPPEIVRAYNCRILNIHPALLPAFGGKGFYGMRVHEAVVASGARFSGPTVHFVDEEFDRGPILAQRAVPVYPSDTPGDVQARVLRQEHIVYPECVAALCDGRVSWRDDGVPILWDGGKQV